MYVDRRLRGRLGDRRLVAIREHRRDLVGDDIVQGDAGNVRPAELLDRRMHGGAVGERDVFLGRLCRQPHALEREEVEHVARLRRVADEILDAEADEARLLEPVVDIEGEQHHVLAAVEIK
jgi:hypothetical protein